MIQPMVEPPRDRLMVIVGSTRAGRRGDAVAAWVAEQVEINGGFDLDYVDLADLALPFLDEPMHPRLGRYTKAHTRAWSERVNAADAFVIVTPEYNYAPSPDVLNALNFLFTEWSDKPVGFVGYGGMSSGSRAVSVLRSCVTSVKLIPVAETVLIPVIADRIGEDHRFVSSPGLDESCQALLNEVRIVASAGRLLRDMRSR